LQELRRGSLTEQFLMVKRKDGSCFQRGPYPLLPQQQDWTSTLLNSTNGNYRTFGEDLSEGVYIAARELFDLERPTVETAKKVAIADYGPPAWAVDPSGNPENQRPPTWVTVIGHRQFWPLAVLNSYTLASDQATGTLRPSIYRKDQYPIPPSDPKPFHFPPVMSVTLIVCLGWSVIHLYYCWVGSLVRSTRPTAYFTPIPRWQHPALITLGSLLLVLLAVTVQQRRVYSPSLAGRTRSPRRANIGWLYGLWLWLPSRFGHAIRIFGSQ
jgi:hypothetical protein